MANPITLSGAPEGLDALRVAERLGEGGTALFIARDASRAAQLSASWKAPWLVEPSPPET